MIKLVIFDAGKILYDYRDYFELFLKNLDEFFKKHGAKNLDKHKSLWEGKYSKDTLVGNLSLSDARKKHLKFLGLSTRLLKEYEMLEMEAIKKLRLKDSGMRETLLELRRKGCKLAVLSDTGQSKKMKRYMLETIGIGDLFDGVFVSSEIGHAKPDKEAYFTVMKHFNAKPNETVFVGHDEDELVGAKKLGIKTISYQGHKSGDFVIQNFKQILNVLENLENK